MLIHGMCVGVEANAVNVFRLGALTAANLKYLHEICRYICRHEDIWWMTRRAITNKNSVHFAHFKPESGYSFQMYTLYLPPLSGYLF